MTTGSCKTRRPSSVLSLVDGGEEGLAQGGQQLPSPRLGIIARGDACGVCTSKPMEILPRMYRWGGVWGRGGSALEHELPQACSFHQLQICDVLNGMTPFPHPAPFPLPSFQACCMFLSIWRVRLSESSNASLSACCGCAGRETDMILG